MAAADGSADAIATEVATAAGRYRLQLGTVRFRGRTGARRGLGVGSSMEFLDFRDYVPGDDLRQVDWRGYARTNQLRIRLHQEEVAPHVDLLVDTSASLASTAGKERAARVLTAALLRWTHREGAGARLVGLGGGLLDAGALTFAGRESGPRLPSVALRPNGVRVLLTDGLWAEDPVPVLRRLMAGSAQFACIQLLDPWEQEPRAEGSLTLVDVETGARSEVHLDARAIAGYRARLQRLGETLRSCVLAQGGLHLCVTADGLAAMCARDLLPAGLVEPA